MDNSQPKKQSFREAAEAFDPASKLFRELMRYKDEILNLRHRGASFDTIRELLLNDNVNVSWKTISRFCRTVIGSDKRHKKRGVPAESPVSVASNSAIQNGAGGLSTALQDRRSKLPGPWVPRKRGPRVADPNNL